LTARLPRKKRKSFEKCDKRHWLRAIDLQICEIDSLEKTTCILFCTLKRDVMCDIIAMRKKCSPENSKI